MRPDLGRFLRNNRGSAMVEFAIVFPVQLFVTMALMQLCLIYVGHQVVGYAAFAAARALLVRDASPGGGQAEALAAARLACSALTGASAAEAGSYSGGDIDLPGWRRQPGSGAAAAKTSVSVLQGSNPADPVIAVEVTHEFELTIPLVGEVFAHPNTRFLWLGGGGGAARGLDRGGWPHIPITERCVLYRPWKAK